MIMSTALAEKNEALAAPPNEPSVTDSLDRIQNALRGLRFGEVTVIVQDGVVVQIERTEKLRLLRRDRER
jgi:hypothetical protein